MEIGQLRSFVAVAEERHVGRAAARLHLTPSPVSRAVRALEHELGVELFVRRHHSVDLTEAGRAVLPLVRSALRSLDEVREAARSAAGDPAPLRLGATPYAPFRLVERVLAGVRDAIGDVRVERTFAPSSELTPGLERGELDLALVHLPLDVPSLDAVALVSYRFRVAMRADDELASRSALRLADLRDREIVLASTKLAPTPMRRLRERLELAGIASVVHMRDQDAVLLANMVRGSRQLTLTGSPRSGAAGALFADPAFALVPLAPGEVDFQLGLAWRRHPPDADTPAAVVVRHLRTQYAANR